MQMDRGYMIYNVNIIKYLIKSLIFNLHKCSDNIQWYLLQATVLSYSHNRIIYSTSTHLSNKGAWKVVMKDALYHKQ